jgi:hypothetical protein
MPRIVWNDAPSQVQVRLPLELHYRSPNEFLGDYRVEVERDLIFVSTDRASEPGAEREILLHIGFIDRTMKFRGRAEEDPAPRGRGAGLWYSLKALDGSVSTELRKVVQQLRQGLAHEAALVPEASEGERRARPLQVREMPATLKMMLAMKAEIEDRRILATDPDPQVLSQLLKNPRITVEEIRSIASRVSLAYVHLAVIIANAAWMKDDQVKLSVARNPRLPDSLAEPLLASLTTHQLKIVAGSASTSAGARRLAHKILYTRGS